MNTRPSVNSPDPREAAINGHSCFLACVVSLLREHGGKITQAQLLANSELHAAFPRWREQPGALTLGEGAALVIQRLRAESYLVAHSKRKALEYWRRPERLGAFVISKRTLNEHGQIVDGLHAWRILECDENKLVFMNPTQIQAVVHSEGWDYLETMVGRIVSIECVAHQLSEEHGHSVPTGWTPNPWG